MRIGTIAAAVAAGLGIGVAPASAVDDLTGVYDMKGSCKNIDSGAIANFKVAETLALVDEGTGVVRFQTFGRGPGVAYLATQTAKPDLGVVSGMTCDKTAATLDGLVIRFDVNSSPADPKLKGTLLLFNPGGGQSASCKISAKRTSLGPVKVGACP